MTRIPVCTVFVVFAACIRLSTGRGDVMQSVVDLISRPGFLETKQKVQNTGNKLVFDIGLNNGKDAQSYIHNGFTVIGVEANPLLVEAVNESNKELIDAGRLVVIHGGVEETVAEPLTFYRNLENSIWSSFEKNKACGTCEPVQVPMLRCEALWVFGKPYYLKIDIEDRHYACVNSLKNIPWRLLPQFVSWEMHEYAHQKPYPVLDTQLILMLFDLGYTTMKIVQQSHEGDISNGLPDAAVHRHTGDQGWSYVHDVIQAGILNPRPAWVDFVMRLNATEQQVQK